MNFEDDERLKERFARQVQDFTDLQNELADRDVGRINRFIGEASETRTDRGRRRAERDTQLTALQIMMNDPHYTQLFRETETKLRDVQSRLDAALETIRLERERIEEMLLTGTLNAEGRREQEHRLKELNELENDILIGQAEIGEMQERMQEAGDPPGTDSLTSYQDRSEEIASDIESRLTKVAVSSEQSFDPKSTGPVDGLTIPEL